MIHARTNNMGGTSPPGGGGNVLSSAGSSYSYSASDDDVRTDPVPAAIDADRNAANRTSATVGRAPMPATGANTSSSPISAAQDIAQSIPVAPAPASSVNAITAADIQTAVSSNVVVSPPVLPVSSCQTCCAPTNLPAVLPPVPICPNSCAVNDTCGNAELCNDCCERRRRCWCLPEGNALGDWCINLSNLHNQHIMVYVFLVFSLVHLLFDILACTLSQLDRRGGGCFTFWGYKAYCNHVSYTIRTNLLVDCPTLRKYLRAGEAFSILACLTSSVLLVLAWVLSCKLRTKLRCYRQRICYANVDRCIEKQYQTHCEKTMRRFRFTCLKVTIIVFMVVNLVFELISWALIAGAFNRRLCQDTVVASYITYGVGFGLNVTIWSMGIIALIFFIVLV